RGLEQQELRLSKQLGTNGQKLDLAESRKRMEEQERSYQTKKRGSSMLQATVDRMMRKMLPRIEHYMHRFLPLLTAGRYRDVRLTTEQDEKVASGGTLQLNIWESAASEYIPRSALSGGMADQISLTLRLAFSVAALPRELNAAPGFMLLDEPLTSFSRERVASLVEMVTGDALGDHFEQVLFISHNSAFDPSAFTYHIYVDNGLVVESTLPSGDDMLALASSERTTITPLPENAEPVDEFADEDEGTATAKIAVPSPVAE
ncbi:MAG TPA: hypothetical protein VFN35_23165, partial [Ktedonobacteraceae bacterium]|nr:hypothetical protein [Ktedonobacteraceae bacterium]